MFQGPNGTGKDNQGANAVGNANAAAEDRSDAARQYLPTMPVSPPLTG